VEIKSKLTEKNIHKLQNVSQICRSAKELAEKYGGKVLYTTQTYSPNVRRLPEHQLTSVSREDLPESIGKWAVSGKTIMVAGMVIGHSGGSAVLTFNGFDEWACSNEHNIVVPGAYTGWWVSLEDLWVLGNLNNSKCTLCGSPAEILFNIVECENQSCRFRARDIAA
jgi:hypothetical protein